MEGGHEDLSNTIDSRVVEMRFDNQQFESGARTSLSTIEKLKEGLKFKGAADGLTEITKASQSVDLSAITDGVEALQTRFSKLGEFANKVWIDICDGALQTGKTLVSALTLDPVRDGLQEYETQINAIQTILSNTRSKGTTLDQVNSALDELNTYADKTIYNFTEMTRNIGTFTAAGVDLDTSTAAIKGIANLAAVSGSNSEQASRAMYQLSQAMASGTVKLQDWNSVVNAGLGGQVFQDSLMETARVHGIAIDEMIKDEGSFRETLSDGWLTTDILTETLSKFTGDLTESQLQAMGYTEEEIKGIIALGQDANDAATKVKTFSQLIDTLKEALGSGWTTSWETIIGTFDESKELFTGISDYLGNVITESAKARNTMLAGWKALGGRTALINGLKSAFQGVLNLIRPIKEGFREIFPKMTAVRLYQITTGFTKMMLAFAKGTSEITGLKSTFKGVFALLDIGKQLFGALASGVGQLLGLLAPLGNGFLFCTGGIGDLLVNLDESIKKTNIFGIVINKLIGFIKNTITAVKEFGSKIQEFLAPIQESLRPIEDNFRLFIESIKEMVSSVIHIDTSKINGMADKLKARFEPFNGLGDLLVQAFGKVGEAISKLIPLYTKLAGVMANAFADLGNLIADSISNFSFEGLFDLINGGLFTTILVSVKKFFGSFKDVTKGAGKIKDSLIGILDGAKGCFEAWQTSIKADVLKKIAVSVGILTASLVVLSMVDSEKLTGALLAMTTAFADLAGSLVVVTKFVDSNGLGGMAKLGLGLIGMSVAVLVLAGAVKKLASLNWEEIGKGLLSVSALIGVLIISANQLSKVSGSFIKVSIGLVIFAEAIKVMSKAVENLGSLNIGQLLSGLLAVGGLLTELSLFLNFTDFEKMGISKATGILILSAALLVMSKAVQGFSQLNFKEIGTGLAAIGGLLAEIAVFTNATGKASHVVSTGAALTIIGGAMLIFAKAVAQFGSMSLSEIGKGLLAIGGALTSVTVSMRLLPKGMLSKAAGMVILGGALNLIARSVERMSFLSWEDLAKGMAALAGSMTVLVAALNFTKGTLGASASILVVSVALNALVPVLTTLGGMSLSEIGKGLLAIGGAFAVIGAAGAVLGPLVPSILGLAGAITLLGIGCLAAGTGILAFSAGMTSLAASGGAIAVSLTTILSSIAGVIPLIFKKIGEGIIELANIVIQGAPAIEEAVTVLIKAAIDALVNNIPAIVNGLFTLWDELADTIISHAPDVINDLFDFCIAVIDGVAARTPELLVSIGNLLSSIFKGITDAIGQFDSEDVLNAGVGLSAFLLVISNLPITGALTGIANLGIFVGGLTAILAALGGLNQIKGFSWLVEEGGNALASIGEAIGKFAGGIIAGYASEITGTLPKIADDLSAFMTKAQPFIDGAKNVDSSVLDGIKALADAIIALSKADITNVLATWLTGGSSLSDFGEELSNFAPYFRQYYDSIKGVDSRVVEQSGNAAKALAEFAHAIPNSGGLISWFSGENSLTKFAEELTTFGPSLKKYADSIRGLDAGVVINSASAAKALAEMAGALPNSGGLAGWVAGENDLSKFAKELASFGPELKAYADSVRGLDAGVVEASSNAAKVLSVMAANLPNQGGMVSWFVGDNKLSTFGKELTTFGPLLKEYADSVSGVDASVVVASANAAKVLSVMAANLPNQGGLVGWIKGDNTLSTFGVQLVSFGESLASYYTKIKGIDTEKAEDVIEQMASLSKLSEIDFTSFNDFVESLKGLANTGVSDFVNTFNGSATKVRSAIDGMIKTAVERINGSEGKFKGAGEKSLTSFINGFKSKTSDLDSSVQAVITNLVTILKSKESSLRSEGEAYTKAIATGLTNAKSSVTAAIHEIMKAGLSAAGTYTSQFKDAGRQMANGLANGIKQNTSSAENSAKKLAQAAINAAKKKAQIKSPSRKFAELGMYMSLGMAKGIDRYAGKAEEASAGAGEKAIDAFNRIVGGISAALSDDFDANPTIRPVLDLSGVESGTQYLDRIFGQGRSIGVTSIRGANAAAQYTIPGRYSAQETSGSSVTDERIVTAIDRLGERVDRLGAQVSSMRVVMDTGATVGQLESTIDKRLGVRAGYRERRL